MNNNEIWLFGYKVKILTIESSPECNKCALKDICANISITVPDPCYRKDGSFQIYIKEY